MKIVCIGLRKTGTTSLRKALRLLGFSVQGDPMANRNLCRDLRADHNPFTSHDAYVDGPFWRHLELVLRHEPEARLICTVRNDRESWMQSRILHVLHGRVARPDKMKRYGINTRKWEQEYDQHREVVESLDHPHLLKLNIVSGDGYEVLCPFLGVEIPDRSFPHKNTSRTKLLTLLDRWNR